MQLDYIEKVNEYGDNLVRLYDFDHQQAIAFLDILKKSLITDKVQLDLSEHEFIVARNCNLILRLSDEDMGITRPGRKKFFCDLTTETYLKMIALLEPFCERDTTAHQYLYDIDSQTDFLFSPAGTW